MRTLVFTALGLLVLSPAALAANPTVTATSDAGCVLVDQSGTAPSLAQQGVVVEVLVEENGVPLANFPRQDIWLGDLGVGHLSVCSGGNVADANTDANGRTTISGSIAASGWTQDGLQVYVLGIPAESPPLPIDVVGTDLSRDGDTNMIDIGILAQRYFSPEFDFLIDLNCNGIEDLGDIGAWTGYFSVAYCQ